MNVVEASGLGKRAADGILAAMNPWRSCLAMRRHEMSNWHPRPRTRPSAALASASHEDDTMKETTCDRRRWSRRAGVLPVAAGLILLTAACGGSAGARSSPPASAASSGLAFARCVRAHGVPDYPDPDSNGQEPADAKQIVRGNPQFPTASRACDHLVPGGQQQTQAPTALDQQSAVRFAACMRTHGEPNFPDATTNSSGQLTFDPHAAGIDPHSPQVLSTAHTCASLLHLTTLPPITSS
jgi:hypothetical protein